MGKKEEISRLTQMAININTFQKYKSENKKIAMLTAYDYSTAKYIDQAGADIVLVGDSLAMVALGYDTTHHIGVEEMLIFTKAVAKGVKNAFVVADMPFMSYNISKEKAIENAGAFIRVGAKGVKIEGCSDYIIDVVAHLSESGVPVMAHLGFTPQLLHTIGGYNIQGKTIDKTLMLLNQAKKLEQAGAFALVLEMLPEESGQFITENINIPTIGIGAGRYCSGQVLVIDDVLGKFDNFTPKFARRYANIKSEIEQGVKNYIDDVRALNFPNESEVFNLTQEEKDKLYEYITHKN